MSFTRDEIRASMLLYAVTDRMWLKEGESLVSVAESVLQNGATFLQIREKDLDEASYRALARDVLAICRKADIPCILHTYATVAMELGADGLHLPLPLLAKQGIGLRSQFRVLGASCHSVQDVIEAQALGATYATVGHIYVTDCKPGVPPRGLAVLRECVQAATIPVYAIGGITRTRLTDVLATGAAGACVMSGLMRGKPPTW